MNLVHTHLIEPRPMKTLSKLGYLPAALALTLITLATSACSPSQNSASVIPVAAAQVKSNGPVAIARGKIEVEGGLLELAPETAGVVQQLLVKEGQSVQKGQVLLRLSDDASRADLAVAESEWQLAQTRQKTRQARLPALKQTVTRWQAAAKEGAADMQSLDEANQAVRDAQSEIDVAAAEVSVAQRKVEQLRALQKRFELRAPEAATVVRVTAHTGSTLQAGVTTLVLLPQRPLVVRAEINESFVASVRPGMHATVVADGDGSGAGNQFPNATVQRISPIFGTARLQDDNQRGPIRVVESVLSFDQVPANAKVGQNVRVSFHE